MSGGDTITRKERMRKEHCVQRAVSEVVAYKFRKEEARRGGWSFLEISTSYIDRTRPSPVWRWEFRMLQAKEVLGEARGAKWKTKDRVKNIVVPITL